MNFDKSEEKRRFHRILYSAEAFLSNDQDEYPCKILDLSLQGCLLRFENAWEGDPETRYKLSLQLSENVNIAMELSIRHVNGTDVGCKCENIDIDSISQLRRLVELNLGDSALLERDLLALSNLHSH